MSLPTPNKRRGLTVREIAVFAMLGALMFASKKIMEVLPNIHLVGVLAMTYTAAFRRKALYPLYIYILLDGLLAGFSTWWLPYLYIWLPLWGAVMLLPKDLPDSRIALLYALIGALHGLSFGLLYAPVQAIIMRYDLPMTLTWISGGLPFDLIHAASNFALGWLVLPLSKLLGRLMKR